MTIRDTDMSEDDLEDTEEVMYHDFIELSAKRFACQIMGHDMYLGTCTYCGTMQSGLLLR